MSVERTRISLTAYAGYRGAEEPRTFLLENRKIVVVAIVERWVEQDADGGNRRRCFRVMGNDGHTYMLCCHELTNDWYLE